MSSTVAKKLINQREECVDDCLAGLVGANPGLRLLSGHRVVLRSDSHLLHARRQVALVSGGGAGHEPTHGGYVGPGMLTAAVSGDVFTSPPTTSILAAIRAVGRGNEAGTLLIVKNYTGDRLNFGLAAEKAKAEGIQVEMVVVGEDCALSSTDKTAGRRGLAGTLLVHKIAGALADQGRTLSEIVAIIKDVIMSMGTVGLSLTPCTVPGAAAASFSLGPDEVELGLGIHGESGVRRMKLLTSSEMVRVALDHMTNTDSATHLRLNQGDRVALLVNNLGGTSGLEMNIVTNDAMRWLEKRQVLVEQVCSGTLMTSMEMAGVSLTLLKLNDQLVACLDAPTTAPAWPRLSPCQLRQPPQTATNSPTVPTVEQEYDEEAGGKPVNEDMAAVVRRAMLYACEALSSCEEHLNLFDQQSGDGDCGTTLRRGADAVRSWLTEAERAGQNPAKLLLKMAAIAEKNMGGTSGALYCLMLTAAAGPLTSDTTPSGWADSLGAAIAAVQKYGAAEPGDRTMLDALVPAHNALTSNLSGPAAVDSRQAFEAAVIAAESGAAATVDMTSRAGRSSYVSKSLLTRPDPGAHAVGIWMRAAYEATRLGSSHS